MADFYNVFNSQRFSEEDGPLSVSGEDNLANAGLVISFEHVPTGKKVFFKAFIVAYTDTFASNWNSEVVYGRADPIQMFKNTARSITLAFKAPATTQSEAYENLGKTQLLTQFLYPTYKNTGLSQTITQSPLVRIKVMNLLSDTSGMSPATAASIKQYFKDYNHGSSGRGLLGAIQNLTVNHNIDNDSGVIEKKKKKKNKDGAFEALLPKLIEVNLTFTPIHEHPLGWSQEGRFGQSGQANSSGELFPYGVQMEHQASTHQVFPPPANNAPSLEDDGAKSQAIPDAEQTPDQANAQGSEATTTGSPSLDAYLSSLPDTNGDGIVDEPANRLLDFDADPWIGMDWDEIGGLPDE